MVLATLAIQKGRCLLGPIQIRTFRQKEAYYGAGSVVTFVETATQTKPVYIGKPKAIIMERAIAHLGVEKSK